MKEKTPKKFGEHYTFAAPDGGLVWFFIIFAFILDETYFSPGDGMSYLSWICGFLLAVTLSEIDKHYTGIKVLGRKEYLKQKEMHDQKVAHESNADKSIVIPGTTEFEYLHYKFPLYKKSDPPGKYLIKKHCILMLKK